MIRGRVKPSPRPPGCRGAAASRSIPTPARSRWERGSNGLGGGLGPPPDPRVAAARRLPGRFPTDTSPCQLARGEGGETDRGRAWPSPGPPGCRCAGASQPILPPVSSPTRVPPAEGERGDVGGSGPHRRRGSCDPATRDKRAMLKEAEHLGPKGSPRPGVAHPLPRRFSCGPRKLPRQRGPVPWLGSPERLTPGPPPKGHPLRSGGSTDRGRCPSGSGRAAATRGSGGGLGPPPDQFLPLSHRDGRGGLGGEGGPGREVRMPLPNGHFPLPWEKRALERGTAEPSPRLPGCRSAAVSLAATKAP